MTDKQAEQTAFPFIGDIKPDRDWWTRIPDETLRAMEAKEKARREEYEASRVPETFVLIACSKTKAPVRSKARDLYRGAIFRKSVAWAEGKGLRWFVVSARYGLLLPDEERSPYDFTMKDWRGGREKEQWAHGVVKCELTRYACRGSHVILIMPETYRNYIQPQLLSAGITFDVPMLGLGQGKQLQWLNEQLAEKGGKP